MSNDKILDDGYFILPDRDPDLAFERQRAEQDTDPTGYQDAMAEFARDLALEEEAELEFQSEHEGDTTMMSD